MTVGGASGVCEGCEEELTALEPGEGKHPVSHWRRESLWLLERRCRQFWFAGTSRLCLGCRQCCERNRSSSLRITVVSSVRRLLPAVCHRDACSHGWMG